MVRVFLLLNRIISLDGSNTFMKFTIINQNKNWRENMSFHITHNIWIWFLISSENVFCSGITSRQTANNKHDYLVWAPEKNAAHHYHFHVSCVMFLWIQNYRCWFFVLMFGGVFSVMYPNIIDNGLYKLSYINVCISFRVMSDRVTTHESAVLILHRHKSNLLRQVSKI